MKNSYTVAITLTLVCLRENTHRNKVFKHIQRVTFWHIPTVIASHLHCKLMNINK